MSKTQYGTVNSGPSWAPSWGRALAVSLGILLILVLLLGTLPHRLILIIDETGWAPWLRDLLVTGLFTVVFAAIAFSLSVLQKNGKL